MKEKLTRGDRWLLVDRGVEQVRKIEGEELITKFSIFDPKYPDDLREKWGRPAKIVEGNGFWIDLSKRKNKSMGFWHRNLDCDELIFVVRGEAKWHTELGVYTLILLDRLRTLRLRARSYASYVPARTCGSGLWLPRSTPPPILA